MVLTALPIVVVMWWATARLVDRIRSALVRWAMVVTSLGAVYACVPETDHLPGVGWALIGAAVADASLRRPAPAHMWAWGWWTLVWSAAYGASEQGRAMVGGLFAVSPVVALAVASISRNRLPTWTLVTTWSIWTISTILVARTGGIADRVEPALLSVAGASAVASVLTMIVVTGTGAVEGE